MADYTSVIEGALIDYTEWLLKQKGDIVGSPAELKGIFYNKLIARLRDLHPTGPLREALSVYHITMWIKPPGYITSLKFEAIGYHSAELRGQIVNGLNQALSLIDVSSYYDRFSYELGKVILDLKKTLDYGRKQTAT